ncbi:MAG: triphosphoribosyl-dephospho-CoA synthase [Eubacteriales bacterium]|nr:triphosphoribosyl-dephospho-CoA synthase [Eubacteriales bacterium]
MSRRESQINLNWAALLPLKKRLVDLAYAAVVAELETSPKPGLVDLYNNGSHLDMNVDLFRRGALVLREFFGHVVELAFARAQSTSRSYAEDFTALRWLGRVWERRLLGETAGVNTQKGMLFAFSLVLYAIADLSFRQPADAEVEIPAIRAEISALGACALKDYEYVRTELAEEPVLDLPWTKEMPEKIRKQAAELGSFQQQLQRGHGLQQRLKGSAGGAREAAAAGYPAVFELALPRLKEALSFGFSQNSARIWALLALISEISDSNLYHRLGEAEARALQADLGIKLAKLRALYQSEGLAGEPLGTVRRLRRVREQQLIDFVRDLDQEFIARNASPGGSADQLALAIFFQDYCA